VCPILHTTILSHHLQLVQRLQTASHIPRTNFSELFPRKCAGNPTFLSKFIYQWGRFSLDGISSHNEHALWDENSLWTLHSKYQGQFLLNVWGGIITSGALLSSSVYDWQCWPWFLKNILPHLLQDVDLLTRIHL